MVNCRVVLCWLGVIIKIIMHVVSSILLCIYITLPKSLKEKGISQPSFAFVTDANRSSS
jgi:hypothetical protein